MSVFSFHIHGFLTFPSSASGFLVTHLVSSTHLVSLFIYPISSSHIWFLPHHTSGFLLCYISRFFLIHPGGLLTHLFSSFHIWFSPSTPRFSPHIWVSSSHILFPPHTSCFLITCPLSSHIPFFLFIRLGFLLIHPVSFAVHPSATAIPVLPVPEQHRNVLSQHPGRGAPTH